MSSGVDEHVRFVCVAIFFESPCSEVDVGGFPLGGGRASFCDTGFTCISVYTSPVRAGQANLLSVVSRLSPCRVACVVGDGYEASVAVKFGIWDSFDRFCSLGAQGGTHGGLILCRLGR